MPAYAVFIREKVRDKSELEMYQQKAKASGGAHPLIPRAAYGRQEVLEGPACEGVVILEFPTFEAAKAWYNSPEYTEARKHRHLAADYRAVIVQGV